MSIKINNTTYEIKFVEKLSNGNGRWDGQVNFDGNDIKGYIRKKRNLIEVVKGEKQREILFHEIVHILFTELAMKKNHLKRIADRCGSNESLVEGLALLMTECFKIKEGEIKK